jgi:hypothetical protein
VRELAERVAKAILERGRKLRRASLFVQVGLIAFFSAVAGIAQFMQFPPSGPDASQVVGIVASVVVAIGSIFVFLTEDDASIALALANEALEKARELESDFDFVPELEADRSRLIELYQALNVMRGLIEHSTAIGDLNEDVFVRKILDAAGRSLTIAFDFGQSDLWTIGIYKAFPDPENAGKVVLSAIAQRRAIACELSDARVWREGTGIMGVCYSSGDEIIIPDLAADGVRSVFGTSANEARSYDAVRYRSMVAVPVNVVGLSEPWGVITATTDNVGHFTPDGDIGVRPDEAARALASMVALAISVCRKSA